MMNNKFFRKCISTVVGLWLGCLSSNLFAAVPIKINAYAIHSGGQIIYRYQVQNDSASIVDAVLLGIDEVGKELPGLMWSSDTRFSDIPAPLPSTECKPFFAMDCSITVFQWEDMSEFKASIRMEGIEKAAPFTGANYIRPNTLSSVAELSVPVMYQSTGYLTATGKVYLLDSNTRNPNGTVVTSVDVPFTKVDTTPPVFSYTLNPAATTAIQRGQMVPINALISVTDDYDPAPEIKLESITSNETLGAADVQGASLGTDDRNFSVLATSYLPVGRVYVITYSATDASGNTAKQYVFLKVN
jgi:hypothetical protein